MHFAERVRLWFVESGLAGRLLRFDEGKSHIMLQLHAGRPWSRGLAPLPTRGNKLL